MARKTIAELQAIFVTGAVPTQQNYADLFESFANLSVTDLITFVSGVKLSNEDGTVGVTFGDGTLTLDGTILLENYSSSNKRNLIVSAGGSMTTQILPRKYYALLSQSTATSQTSGSLVKGREYTLTNYIAGDDFSNLLLVSGNENETGAIYWVYNELTPTTWTNSSQMDYGGEPYVVSEIGGVVSPFINSIESVTERIRFTRGGVGIYTITCTTPSMFPLEKTDVRFGIGDTASAITGMVIARDTTTQPDTITFETLDYSTGLASDGVLYYTAITIDVYY